MLRGAEAPSVDISAAVRDHIDRLSVVPEAYGELVQDLRASLLACDDPSARWPPVDNAVREIFFQLIATVDISDSAFSQVWTLVDLITVLGDNDLCEPALNFLLIESLLDSQTIEGCRLVFDYLESRRERLIAKNFSAKSLVILRCCNELLRRLSRAEDTVFCGRVFIFLFQSFPLGDKSSVNLRGEFHTENVTLFDPAPKKSEDAIKPMELDTMPQPESSGAQTPASITDADATQKTTRGTPIPRRAEARPEAPPPDLDTLYPKFWSLQSLFSSPTRLFDPTSMSLFKDGITATLACFKSISTSTNASAASVPVNQGIKRKRSDLNGTNSMQPFNPKYLTNRDLFDLELHDLAFRRHILVQALIMLDFLLSLSPAARGKAQGTTNKAVSYSHSLSDEDLKYCLSTRASIATYLQQQGPGNEGKYYCRMVDTVLSRDKNWARWKAESCPPIARLPVQPATYISAQDSLLDMCSKKPMITPPGASDFDFLKKSEPLEALKYPNRRMPLPTLEQYYKSIETDVLDMDFAVTDAEKSEIEEKKAGKLWRALRLAVNDGDRFTLCEKIQDGVNLKALLGEDEQQNQQTDAEQTQEASAPAEAIKDQEIPGEALTDEQLGRGGSGSANGDLADEEMKDFAPPGHDDD